ncbi:MAG: hypothetical protein GX251_03405 [Firmicutes bacterium]|nr:hypothetical protein [Bacillota bacterium]
MRSKKHVFIFVILLCLLSFPLIAYGNADIEDESIEEVLGAVMSAFREQDAEALAGFWIYPIEQRT